MALRFLLFCVGIYCNVLAWQSSGLGRVLSKIASLNCFVLILESIVYGFGNAFYFVHTTFLKLFFIFSFLILQYLAEAGRMIKDLYRSIL